MRIKEKIKPIINSLSTGRHSTGWQLAILIFLPLIIYIKVIGFDYTQMDDDSIIKDNYNVIGSIGNIKEAFTRDAFLSKNGNAFYSPMKTIIYYRPMQTISYMLDASVSGKNPRMYHFTNLIIHIITVVSFYFLLNLLFSKNFNNKEISKIPFLLSLLFSVHPLLSSAVSWIPARSDLLIGLFGIWLFITFDKYFSKIDKSRKIIFFVLHTFLFLVIIITKETAILFPIILLLYFFLIKNSKIKKDTTSLSYRSITPFLIIWAFSIFLYLYIRNKISNVSLSESSFGIIPFIKNLPVIPTTIGKFFIPINLSTMPLYNIYEIYSGIIIMAIIIIITLKYLQEGRFYILTGSVWFLLFTIPPMFSRVNYADYVFTYLEHRTYLPVIGLFLIVAFLFKKLIIRIHIRNFIWIYLIILSEFIFLANENCKNYKDAYTFYFSPIKYNNPGAYMYKGTIFSKIKDYSNAMECYNMSIALNPNFPTVYINRGYVYSILNDHVKAENDYSRAISLDSTQQILAYMNRSLERMKSKNYVGAFSDINKALTMDTTDSRIYFTKGTLELSKNNYQDAVLSFTKAINFNKDTSVINNNSSAYNSRGFAYYNLKNYSNAIDDYKKAIQIKPDFELAFNNLGVALRDSGIINEAIKTFDAAINLSGNYAEAYYNRGLAKQMNNDLNGARDDWNEAFQLGYSSAKELLDKFSK
jgi:tetratricopeptide (TPR) repeat protein